MAVTPHDQAARPARHVPAPGFVRTLAFVADVVARSLESYDFQLLPVGLLESVFGLVATASERLEAVAELYRCWEERGARLPQRYYVHVAEPAGAVLTFEAHHAYRRAVGGRTAVQDRRIIESIARELGLALAGGGRSGPRRTGTVLAESPTGAGRVLEVATKEVLKSSDTQGHAGACDVHGIHHVRTRIFVAPLAELVIERTPGLVDRP